MHGLFKHGLQHMPGSSGMWFANRLGLHLQAHTVILSMCADQARTWVAYIRKHTDEAPGCDERQRGLQRLYGRVNLRSQLASILQRHHLRPSACGCFRHSS